MENQHEICRVSIAPLRAAAKDQAEIVSQLLFGDQVLILERLDKWLKVRSVFDDYEGYVDFKQIHGSTAEQIYNDSGKTYVAPASALNTLTLPDGSKLYLAAGSTLPEYHDGHCKIGEKTYKVGFEPVGVMLNNDVNKLVETAMFFQHAPYLWGGRTLFGIDCSGFVQIVYKMQGLNLHRDASQQALQGNTVHFLPEVQPGDVAFFDNEEGRIIHVGILLNHKEIIHASGQVRIDPIDDQGIYNPELKRYSHKLRIIKRFL